ncbi:MAG: PIG-L family deacetylase [Bacillota bacterium]|nr:PIG-L family deacetylase [Bacillota bacterium]
MFAVVSALIPFNIFLYISIIAIILLDFMVVLLYVFLFCFKNKDISSGSYDKEQFSNKKIMFFVPHPDDELNLGAGLIERFIEFGSDVWVVFATNGDYIDLENGKKRINEAIRSLKAMGVLKNNVILLGYANDWIQGDILNSTEKVFSSMWGNTKTYGLQNHQDFHFQSHGVHAEYTKDNYLNDIKEVLQYIKPDSIFCVDMDTHPDHRITSLLFEQAMSELLIEQRQWKPQVFKGFAYRYAWFAPRDFYTYCSTLENSSENHSDLLPFYTWDSRLRFPIHPKVLTPLKRSSSAYQSFLAHGSQGAVDFFDCIINSDKIYWERRTDIIPYKTAVSLSTGDTVFKNFFCFTEINNIVEERPTQAKFISTDENDAVVFQFGKQEQIAVIWIHLLSSNNINAVMLDFGSGWFSYPVTLTEENKAVVVLPSTIITDKISLKSIDIQNHNTSFSFVEFFSTIPEKSSRWIKIADKNNNFIYSAITQNDQLQFSVYDTEKDGCYQILTDGQTQYEIKANEVFSIPVTKKKITLRVQLVDNSKVFDEIKICKQSKLTKNIMHVLYKFERLIDRMFWNITKIETWFVQHF